MTLRPDLSIVVPAYNERQRLPPSLDAIRRYVEAGSRRVEVIVVDDGSTDGTAALVEELAAGWAELRVLRLPANRGKGAAVRAGIAATGGAIVAYTDADLSAPIEQLDALLAALDHSDVAIASRALPGARLLRRQSPAREAAGKLYAAVARALILRGVPDAHCGLKAYRGDVGRAVFSRVREQGILFDIEALLIATRLGATIAQHPAVWSHEPDSRIRFGPGKAWAVAVALARIKARHRIGWPPRAAAPLSAVAP